MCSIEYFHTLNGREVEGGDEKSIEYWPGDFFLLLFGRLFGFISIAVQLLSFTRYYFYFHFFICSSAAAAKKYIFRVYLYSK